MERERTVYYNCTVHTMDRANPRAEAFAVEGSRIAAVGSRDEVEGSLPAGTRRVDLHGGAVIPGFNDCHCHILSFGLTLRQIDLGPEAVRTIDDIKAAVAREAAETPDDQWVIGRGYNQNVLAERRHPTREDLDGAVPDRPVLLHHTSGHALTCNSRALELAGIDANTVTPSGGEIERDARGQPNGVLKESAMDLLEDAVPPPTREEGRDAVMQAMRTMASQGITSASDAATGAGRSVDPQLEIYRAALASGDLAGRITLMPQILYVAPRGGDGAVAPQSFDAGDQPEWLAVGATKIFSDGALTTRTAALREPYSDSETNTGILIWEPDVLADMIRSAHEAGWQIATHAIGDRAVALVVDCYAEALKTSPRSNHRHRIEHCMLLDEAIAARMAELGIIPAMQPGFVSRLGDAYIAGLGLERASTLMPVEWFERLGVAAAFSSDRPVIPGLPLQGVHAAVARKTPEGVTLGAEHTVPALEAIRLYTAGSAYATHTEQMKGTLRPGMLADFTVLSLDPQETPPEDFTAVQVVMTVAGGRVTFAQ